MKRRTFLAALAAMGAAPVVSEAAEPYADLDFRYEYIPDYERVRLGLEPRPCGFSWMGQRVRRVGNQLFTEPTGARHVCALHDGHDGMHRTKEVHHDGFRTCTVHPRRCPSRSQSGHLCARDEGHDGHHVSGPWHLQFWVLDEHGRRECYSDSFAFWLDDSTDTSMLSHAEGIGPRGLRTPDECAEYVATAHGLLRQTHHA